MSIHTLSINDVPTELRNIGISNAKKHIQMLLNNPYLSSEQRKELQDQLRSIGKCKQTLNVGKNHSVELSETVLMKEK